MLNLFKLHWYSKSNLIVMFLTLREVVSILKIQLWCFLSYHLYCGNDFVFGHSIFSSWKLDFIILPETFFWWIYNKWMHRNQTGCNEKKFVVWGTGIPKTKNKFQVLRVLQVLRVISSIEYCPYDEPDRIENKVRLYCLVVLVYYTTMKLRRTISFKLHWPHNDLQLKTKTQLF